MKCAICEIVVGSIEEAVEENWIPIFYEGDDPHGPACADCTRGLLQPVEEGEMEVRGQYRGKIVYHDELNLGYLRRNSRRQ
jgi:hypothetical protein